MTMLCVFVDDGYMGGCIVYIGRVGWRGGKVGGDSSSAGLLITFLSWPLTENDAHVDVGVPGQ